MNTSRLLLVAALLASLNVSATGSESFPLQAKLLPNPVSRQKGSFGECIAGHGNYVVVGAPQTHHSGPGGWYGGFAGVYDATTGALLHVLKKPAGANAQFFGRSVAISGKLVLVGATLKAYLYDLEGPAPSEPIATFTPPAGAAGWYYGSAVAISGARLAVSTTYGFDFSNPNGTIYIYDLSGENPQVPALTINNPTPADGDQFGGSIALAGGRLVVGAPGDYVQANTQRPGSVYVYDLDGGDPSVPTLTINNAAPGDTSGFGRAVAVSGNWVVIGAGRPKNASPNLPAIAYLYQIDNAAPTVPVTTFQTQAAAPGGALSVAVGNNYVLVGVDRTDEALLYDANTSTPGVAIDVLRNPGATNGSQYGPAVALVGARIAIGAPVSGYASLYNLEAAAPRQPTAKLENATTAFGDRFGGFVAATDQFVAIGDSQARLYVYDLFSQTPTTAKLILSANGVGVAISGTLLVVGKNVYDLASETPGEPVLVLPRTGPCAMWGSRLVVGRSGAELADVYELESATPDIPIAVLKNPTSDYRFTVSSVSIWENSIALGIPDAYAANIYGAGVVCLYDLGSSTPDLATKTIRNPDFGNVDRFGGSVGISDTILAVGSYNPSYDSGAIGAKLRIYDFTSSDPEQPLAFEGGEGGVVVAVYQRTIVAGTRGQPSSNANPPIPTPPGSVKVYQNPNTPQFSITRLPGSNASTDDGFGHCVAMSAERIVAGNSGDDTLDLDAGAAYIYGAPLGPSVPAIAVQDQHGGWLSSGSGTVDFGAVASGGSVERWFTITNTGNASLEEITATIDELATDVFEITGAPSLTLAPGESSTFTLYFSSATPGYRTVQLHITSNDPVQNPFAIAVVARSLSEQEAWRAYYFDDPDGVADGADGADPDGDGNDNLFEYTAGVDPTDPASRFHLRIEAVPNEAAHRAITFSPLVEGRSYEAKWKPNLSDAEWIPLTDFTFSDNGEERTVIDLSAAETEKFYHIEIAKP